MRMPRKRTVLLVLFGLFLLVAIFISGGLNLYLMRGENDISFSSTGFSEDIKADFSPRIGIVVQDLERQGRLKGKLARCLRDRLETSNHCNVCVLQSGDYADEPVDVLLVVDFDLYWPLTPLYKKISYKLKIDTFNFSDSAIRFDYTDTGKFTILGIFTRWQNQDLIIQERVKNFVEKFNKHLNENMDTFYAERLPGDQTRIKNLRLKNTATAEIRQEFGDFIPGTARNLFVYRDQKGTEGVLLGFTTEDDVDDLEYFYQEWVGNKLYDRGHGYLGYRDYRDDGEFRIMIRHLDASDLFNPKKLKQRTVTVFNRKG